MKVLITGVTGTLAPRVQDVLQAQGVQIIGWNHHQINPQDGHASQAFVGQSAPDAVIHMAMGSAQWAAGLARMALERHAHYVFVSTAMVFDHVPDGPHAPDHERTAKDDYGRYKVECEDAVRAVNSHATIARIGWQIDAQADGKAQGNNMLAHLDQQQARDGVIRASRLWKPATSFMQDTALGFLQAITLRHAGVLHLDSNATDGLDFAQLVERLKHKFTRHDWRIEPTTDYVHDQRLSGHAGWIADISQRV